MGETVPLLHVLPYYYLPIMKIGRGNMRLSLHVYLCVTNNPCPNGATCTIGDHACTNISARVLMTLLTKMVVSHEFLYGECMHVNQLSEKTFALLK